MKSKRLKNLIKQALENEPLMKLETNEDIDRFLELFPLIGNEENEVKQIVQNVISRLQKESDND